MGIEPVIMSAGELESERAGKLFLIQKQFFQINQKVIEKANKVMSIFMI